MKLDHQQRNLYNIGVSYKKADAQTRGRYSLSKENQIKLLKEAKEIGFEGIFILSTCNRTEITGFAEHPKMQFCTRNACIAHIPRMHKQAPKKHEKAFKINTS